MRCFINFSLLELQSALNDYIPLNTKERKETLTTLFDVLRNRKCRSNLI